MTPDKPKESSFAALFEQQPKSATKGRKVRVGDKLDVVVVQVGKEAVFVELDGKRQAYIDSVELRAPDGTMTVKTGDRVTAHVVEIDEQTGNVRLGRSMGKPGSLAAIEQARDAKMAVDGKVTGINKGGLEVDLEGTRAFCPISQADNKFVHDASAMVGKTFRFLVTEIREGGKSIVLSRKAVLDSESKDAAQRFLKELSAGAIVRGTVTGVREFGAFVDLGGVEGLIPTSEASHDRGVSIGDIVKPGDLVEVQVREIREVTPTRPNDPTVKITLSLKALAADPWDGIADVLSEGKVVHGVVMRLMDFGAFVRLAAGVEGLLHVSEMGGKIDHPSRLLKVGQQLAVVVKKIDREAKKVSLVPAPEGLAAGTTVQGSTIAIGSIVTGKVDRIETYGVFIQIDGTAGRAGRGLVPMGELGTQRGTDTRKLFPEGSTVTAKVLETGDGRLRLSIRQVKDDEERAQFDGYREKVNAPATFGTFGDLLNKKRKK